MDGVLIVKIVVFILAIIASRVLLSKAGAGLNEAQRDRLLKASATVFLLRKILVVGAIAINVWLLSQPAPIRETAGFYLSVAVAAGVVILAAVNYAQVKQLDLPGAVTRNYLLSVFILLAGIAILMLPI